MTKHSFSGYMSALITPFANDHVDEAAYQRLVDWQITEGIKGVIPCGTTGEVSLLTDAEQVRLFALCIEAAAGRVPVVAGCGSNSTRHAIELTLAAQKAGADAALHVTPYYNKPTQEGLYQHFKAIHDATNIPIILYNIPGRSVVNISIETQARLAQLPRIVGVKDATGDIIRPARTRMTCGPDFIQLTGEDANTLPFLAQGGHGAISVTSNIAPRLCTQMYDAYRVGDMATAQAISDSLLPLHDAMFVETSPAPVKYAASLLGLCRNELRLPLVPVTKATEKQVEDAMDKLGMLASLPKAARA